MAFNVIVLMIFVLINFNFFTNECSPLQLHNDVQRFSDPVIPSVYSYGNDTSNRAMIKVDSHSNSNCGTGLKIMKGSSSRISGGSDSVVPWQVYIREKGNDYVSKIFPLNLYQTLAEFFSWFSPYVVDQS